MALGAINRFLSLESYVRTRPTEKKRWRIRATKASASDRFMHADVVIDGREVSVTEDDVGVVELREN